MLTTEANWDPDDWEQHVFGLLRDRHGSLNVNKVPARHKGDFGLDYYSLSNKVAYQCYAVEEPCTVADRASKQIAKITVDLAKFCSNRAKLTSLFGNVLIERWVLVSPLHDSSSVNTHCTKKTLEIRGLKLAYVSMEFEALIQDLDSFDMPSRIERSLRRSLITLPKKAVTEANVSDWSAGANNLLNALESKLRKRIAAAGIDTSLAVGQMVRAFLEKETVLDELRTSAPSLYEDVVGVFSRRLARMTLYGPPAEGLAHDVLRSETEALIAELRNAIGNLSTATAQELALGAIAEWLMRCPLDFPPYAAQP